MRVCLIYLAFIEARNVSGKNLNEINAETATGCYSLSVSVVYAENRN